MAEGQLLDLKLKCYQRECIILGGSFPYCYWGDPGLFGTYLHEISMQPTLGAATF